MPKIEERFRHLGSKPDELRKAVKAREKEAEQELGGPVIREHRFVDGGKDVIFMWRLA